MNCDTGVSVKEIWACVEINGSLVNFHQEKVCFSTTQLSLIKAWIEPTLLVHTHISSHAIKALNRHGQSLDNAIVEPQALY